MSPRTRGPAGTWQKRLSHTAPGPSSGNRLDVACGPQTVKAGGMRDDLAVFARYARGLPGWLRETVGPEEALHRIEHRLRTREESFLTVLEHAVYAQERSPYRALLLHAGIRLDDARALVSTHGVEGTLDRLHGLGVYV